MSFEASENGIPRQTENQEESEPAITRNPARLAAVAGGGLLTAVGLRRGGVLGFATALAGGNLLYGGIKGSHPVTKYMEQQSVDQHSESAVVKHGEGIKEKRTVTVDRPRDELYRFWRDFKNLAIFMEDVERIDVLDDTRSHWVMRVGGKRVEWMSEIFNEKENELIAWRSDEDAPFANAGSVTFSDASGGRGTVVSLTINYRPPLGRIAAAIARLLPDEPAGIMASTSLSRFKQYIETGEVATSSIRREERKRNSNLPGTLINALKRSA